MWVVTDEKEGEDGAGCDKEFRQVSVSLDQVELVNSWLAGVEAEGASLPLERHTGFPYRLLIQNG